MRRCQTRKRFSCCCDSWKKPKPASGLCLALEAWYAMLIELMTRLVYDQRNAAGLRKEKKKREDKEVNKKRERWKAMCRKGGQLRL